MYVFDAPLVARFFAIEELRAAGWRHRPGVAVGALSKQKREDAERSWSGATYCPECATAIANARRSPPASRVPASEGPKNPRVA
jgi:hypothetical protein